MVCNVCGTSNPENADRCIKCGSPVTAEQTTYFPSSPESGMLSHPVIITRDYRPVRKISIALAAAAALCLLLAVFFAAFFAGLLSSGDMNSYVTASSVKSLIFMALSLLNTALVVVFVWKARRGTGAPLIVTISAVVSFALSLANDYLIQNTDDFLQILLLNGMIIVVAYILGAAKWIALGLTCRKFSVLAMILCFAETVPFSLMFMLSANTLVGTDAAMALVNSNSINVCEYILQIAVFLLTASCVKRMYDPGVNSPA